MQQGGGHPGRTRPQLAHNSRNELQIPFVKNCRGGLWGASKIYHLQILPLKKDNPEGSVPIMILLCPLVLYVLSQLCQQAPPPSPSSQAEMGIWGAGGRAESSHPSTPFPEAGAHTREGLPPPWGAGDSTRTQRPSAANLAQRPHETEAAKRVGGPHSQ